MNKMLVTLLMATAIVAQAQAAGRDRQLHGFGPEGEEVAITLTWKDPENCHGREMPAVGVWPDGTTRRGCHVARFNPYEPVRVRWIGERDGKRVEWTVEYLDLSVRYVPRG